MQQVFDGYIVDLTKVYSNVLEEVGMLSKLMAGQLYSKDDILLKQVVRLDSEIPKLRRAYPQFDYLTKYIFESEDMFDAIKRSMAISPEIFPQYEKEKNILTPVLLAKLSHITTENDSCFILHYLKENKIKELCWKECFANIYKNHFSLRSKARDMFYDFLNHSGTLKIQCGEEVISIFDGTKSSVQDIMMLLQKIFERSKANYDFFAEKKALNKINFFHYCFLKDIPEDYAFIRMLYHTRYLNAAEFSNAYRSMHVSKMLEYDFGLAQRILPRLFSRLSGIPYEKAVEMIRKNKNLDCLDLYLKNEHWLCAAALTFAEVFGVKYEAYLKRVSPFMSLYEASFFIKNIEYGNPKNKLLGKFLQNNVVYQKTSKFLTTHNSEELEKICNAWKNIPYKNIWASRYKTVLNLSELYCYQNVNHYEFSKEAMLWRMPEKEYITAESAFLEGLNVPTPFDIKSFWTCGEYVGRFLSRSDVRVGFFGHYTGCCQHYTGTGASAAIACVKDKNSQLFVIEKKGRIIAGSFVWQTDINNHKGVCFDSVEVLKSYEKRPEIQKIYQKVYDSLSKDYQKITFGKTPFNLVERVKALPVPDGIYTDARAQFSFKRLSKEMD